MPRMMRPAFLALALVLLSLCPPQVRAADTMPPGAGAGEDPAAFVEFVQEDDSDCLMREGKHVVVHSTHPSRTIRVWLDRYYRNVGTGDRSHSDLKPGAEPEALGCSHVGDGTQEWRVARALFLD